MQVSLDVSSIDDGMLACSSSTTHCGGVFGTLTITPELRIVKMLVNAGQLAGPSIARRARSFSGSDNRRYRSMSFVDKANETRRGLPSCGDG
jgi:hypothetical protein